jgi:hypothetical protein
METKIFVIAIILIIFIAVIIWINRSERTKVFSGMQKHPVECKCKKCCPKNTDCPDCSLTCPEIPPCPQAPDCSLSCPEIPEIPDCSLSCPEIPACPDCSLSCPQAPDCSLTCPEIPACPDTCCDDSGEDPQDKITICHRKSSNSNTWQTITVSANALSAHYSHGDILGPCEIPLSSRKFISKRSRF